MNANFDPFPALTTERLVLRKIKHSDVNEVFFLRSDKEVLKHLSTPPVQTNEEAEMWINKVINLEKKNESINWALTLKNDDTLIGSICLWNLDNATDKGEVGYSMHPRHHGKGLMNEAMIAILDYGFNTMKLSIVEAITNENNTPSRNLLERNNFTRDALLEKQRLGTEEPWTAVIYTIRK